MMFYEVGGVQGYASLCGSINGAACIIDMAFGPHVGKEIIRRLFRWYEQTPFPTPLTNEYAKEHKFPFVEIDKSLPSVSADSVLCHAQVSKWCSITGYRSGSKERSERCSRITAAVARQAVILMNAALKGKLNEVFPFKLSHETASCKTCHFKSKHNSYENGGFVRGFMDCKECHEKDLKAHVKAAPLPKAFGANIGTLMGAATVGTVAGIGSHLVVSNVAKKGGNDEEDKG